MFNVVRNIYGSKGYIITISISNFDNMIINDQDYKEQYEMQPYKDTYGLFIENWFKKNNINGKIIEIGKGARVILDVPNYEDAVALKLVFGKRKIKRNN